MADKIAITFDEDNQIRVLEANKFRETDMLRNEGTQFISSKAHFYHSYLQKLLTFKTLSNL